MTVREVIEVLSTAHPDAEVFIGESCCPAVPVGEIMGGYDRNPEYPDEWSFTDLSGMRDEKAVLIEEA